MFAPFFGSLVLGFVKGLTSKPGEEQPFNVQMDMIGPMKEEFLYRGAPLWAAPGLPYGTTAVSFAIDHILHDARRGPMTGSQMLSRFGDVLLGGLAYESAFRSSGIIGAIASHSGHNLAVGLGSRLRSRKTKL